MVLSRSAHRSDPALGEPPDDVTALPHLAINADAEWFREHGSRPTTSDNGCWWFNSQPADRRRRPDGRFDLAAPRGTCYVTDRREAAMRERCGRYIAKRLPIPQDHITGRVISRFRVPLVTGPIADLCKNASAALGVTAEIHVTSNYRLTARWAAASHRDGFGGLRYRPRFSLDDSSALAIFGDAGPQPTRQDVLDSMSLDDYFDTMASPPRVAGKPSSTVMAAFVGDHIDPN